jgi:hypothetical protein
MSVVIIEVGEPVVQASPPADSEIEPFFIWQRQVPIYDSEAFFLVVGHFAFDLHQQFEYVVAFHTAGNPQVFDENSYLAYYFVFRLQLKISVLQLSP